MARPKRVSVAERNAAAIAGTASPATPDEASEEVSGGVAPQGATPPPEKPQPPIGEPKAPAATTTRRSSVYLTEGELKDARSAYLVDYDHRPGSPASFGLWAAAAVEELARLSGDERQGVRDTVGAGGPSPHKSQQLLLPDDVADAVADAMRQDRLAGVVDRSRNVFYSYALRWQSEQAKKRAGLTELPEPPARLPRLDSR